MNEMPIKPMEMISSPIESPRSIDPSTPSDGVSFAQWLNKSVASVNEMQAEADSAAQKLVTGENKDIHGTMIAMQKANISMTLMMEVRNKIISAYDEIKRMQF